MSLGQLIGLKPESSTGTMKPFMNAYDLANLKLNPDFPYKERKSKFGEMTSKIGGKPVVVVKNQYGGLSVVEN